MPKHATLMALLLGAVGLSLLVGCPSSPPATPPPGPAPTTGPTTAPSGAANPNFISQGGSTTLLPIAEKWSKAYSALHPEVSIGIGGGGSGVGIHALMEKSLDIANASRQIKPEEIEQARKLGVNPVEHVIGHDGIAVIVNPANPLTQISVEKLSAMYSGKLKKWSDVGGSGGDIVLVNRESSSGTYEAFKELVLNQRGKAKDLEFAPEALAQSSTAGVLTTVAQTKGAIGYVGLGYVNSSVKVLAVIPLGGGQAIQPTPKTVRDKTYPVARDLYVYTNGEPSGKIKAYLDWCLSPEGQKLVHEAGFVALQ